MDPASPLFKNHPKLEYILDKSDAKFVDVIHTSDNFGYNLDMGHVDYYPNGGLNQPGCGDLDVACSHERGRKLFAESIASNNQPLVALPCTDFKTYESGDCFSKCDSPAAHAESPMLLFPPCIDHHDSNISLFFKTLKTDDDNDLLGIAE